MKTDFSGIWLGRIRRRQDRLEETLSTLRNRLSALLWGIHVGKKCRFFGRARFYRTPGGTIIIGDQCTFRSSKRSNFAGINRPCMISTIANGANIKIGSGCGFSGTVIGAAQSVCIGNNVLCGVNVTITDTDWHGVEPGTRRDIGRSAPVIIEDNVWIGMNTIVLKGVTIGRNSVIGAGSVVTKSIRENAIASGNPATVIRDL